MWMTHCLRFVWLLSCTVIGCSSEEGSDSPPAGVGGAGGEAGMAGSGGSTGGVGGSATAGNGGTGGTGGAGAAGTAGSAGEAGHLLPHEVPIDLPSCDPAPDVRIIDSLDDWDDINDPAVRVFCVHPGDYSDAGLLELTADGSVGQERWIRWYDPDEPDDTTSHPATMAGNKRAIISHLRFGREGNAASHWIIDRLTCHQGTSNNVIGYESSYNVLNRMLIEECRGHMVTFISGAQDNTLQNSVVRNTEIIANTDRTCINLASGQVGTRIVGNEIYNCAGDGIQFSPKTGHAVVEGNDIYLTSALYSDCQGNRDPGGQCACAENALDFKSPRDRPWPLPEDQWARIEGNRFWGFRPTDSKCGGTGSPGTPVAVGSGADNAVDSVLIRGNIVFDSSGGIAMGVAPVRNISVIGNLLWDVAKGPDGVYTALSNLRNNKVEFYFNTVVDAQHWFRNGPNAEDNDVRCNVAINSGGRPYSSVTWGANSTADYNFFYNTEPYTTESPSHDIEMPSADDAAHEEYCFIRKRWTAPEQVCIPYGRPTPQSPHFDACDPDIGSRTGIGVDDSTGTDLGGWLGQ